MQEYQSHDVTALAKALLAVQKQLQPAFKDAANHFTKSNYATLNSVMEACRDALQSNGIWMTQLPMPTPEHLGSGHLALQTKFTHASSGQWQASLTIVPLPKNDPQGMGSAMTYARRYALTAMLGIVTEDDDGQAAVADAKLPTKRTVPPRQSKPTNVPQHTHPPQTKSETIPHIDGVSYQEVTASDGRTCIVATGNTQAKKELLKGIGFQWNPQRKMWWKYADAM